MTKPWERGWNPEWIAGRLNALQPFAFGDGNYGADCSAADARMFAAAPAMARALCLAEKSSHHEGGVCGALCAVCGAEWDGETLTHLSYCLLDAALTAAGLNAAAREAVRSAKR